MTQGEIKTPESVLADKNGRILAEILSNSDLTKLTYALLLQSGVICNEVQKPLSALRFTRITVNEDYFSFQFYFGEPGVLDLAEKVTLKPDFETYIGAKNAGLVKFLNVNPHIIGLLENMLTVLENFAKHKNKKLADVEIKRAGIMKQSRTFRAQMSIGLPKGA